MFRESRNSAQKNPVPAHDARGIIVFLLLAFGLAWLPFATTLFGMGALPPIVMPFAPAIACFVVRKWVTGEGFGDAGLRPSLHRWRLYLVAVLWPIPVSIGTVLVASVLPGTPHNFGLPWGVAAPSVLDVLGWAAVSVLLAPIVFGEEFGWRGYLQVRLCAGRPLAAAVVVGAIWGLWHVPLILSGGEGTKNTVITVLLFPVFTIVMSVFLGWLRERSGSVWVGSVAHAANNVTADNLGRLSFTGRVDGALGSSAMISSLAGQTLVLGVIVGYDVVMRRKRDATGVRSRVSGAKGAATVPS